MIDPAGFSPRSLIQNPTDVTPFFLRGSLKSPVEASTCSFQLSNGGRGEHVSGTLLTMAAMVSRSADGIDGQRGRFREIGNAQPGPVRIVPSPSNHSEGRDTWTHQWRKCATRIHRQAARNQHEKEALKMPHAVRRTSADCIPASRADPFLFRHSTLQIYNWPRSHM